jgi:hypothetical protein
MGASADVGVADYSRMGVRLGGGDALQGIVAGRI